MCFRGVSEIQKMFRAFPDIPLRGYLIWQPVLQSDDDISAARRTRQFTDQRLTHFWDGNRLTGKLWQPVLEDKRIPWDVYLLYHANARWEEAPTAPDFWLHRLNRPNIERFELKMKQMLDQMW